MDNKKENNLEPGMRFYYNLPDWAKKQSDEVFASLVTVLSEIVVNKESATKESILEILNNLGDTDEVKKTILELIKKHSDDLGEVTWVKEDK